MTEESGTFDVRRIRRPASGTVVALIGMAAGVIAAFATNATRLTTVEQHTDRMETHISASDQQISANREQIAVLKAQLEDIRRILESINAKLDRAEEERHK